MYVSKLSAGVKWSVRADQQIHYCKNSAGTAGVGQEAAQQPPAATAVAAHAVLPESTGGIDSAVACWAYWDGQQQQVCKPITATIYCGLYCTGIQVFVLYVCIGPRYNDPFAEQQHHAGVQPQFRLNWLPQEASFVHLLQMQSTKAVLQRVEVYKFDSNDVKWLLLTRLTKDAAKRKLYTVLNRAPFMLQTLQSAHNSKKHLCMSRPAGTST